MGRRLVERVSKAITPRRTDTLLGVGFTLFCAIEVLAEVATARHPWVPSLVAGLVATVALVWRRRSPAVATAVALGSLTVASLTGLVLNPGWDGNQIPVFAGLAGLILVYSSVRYAEGWHRGAAWAGVIASSAADEAAKAHGIPFGSIASIVIFTTALVAVAQAFRFRAELRAEQEEQARTGEREQLARELHDVVAHHVSAMVVQATAALSVLDKQPEAARPALQFIKTSGQETMGEMRRMVGILRGSDAAELAPRRGIAGLDDLLVPVPGGPPVRLLVVGEAQPVDVTVGQSVHRIVQESITNARRHARSATGIDVTLRWGDDRLDVDVANDGAGAQEALAVEGGFGLVGMAERARLLDGTFTAGPRPGGGWLVRCCLPLAPDGRAPDPQPAEATT